MASSAHRPGLDETLCARCVFFCSIPYFCDMTLGLFIFSDCWRPLPPPPPPLDLNHIVRGGEP